MKKAFTILLFTIGIIWVGYNFWQKKNADFKYNLPIENKQFEKHKSESISPQIGLKELPNIPLISEDNYSLNELYLPSLKHLYQHLVDSIKITTSNPVEISSTTLVRLNSSTIIQIHQFHKSIHSDDYDKREIAITQLGLLLENPNERSKFINDYLFKFDIWLPMMKKLHIQLMQEPNNEVLNYTFLQFIKPASSDQILDYMISIQFLDRGPRDEYYTTNPNIMERFNLPILVALKDKIDDYHWWAAYPERDAEQALEKIIENKNL